MSELGEGVAVAQIKEVQMQQCDWKKCKKTHEKSVTYPNNGKVERNGTYESDWVKAGLEPWELHGPGTDSKATLKDYQDETRAAKYAKTAAKIQHPAYHTQKHHLISVNLLSNVSKLGHNAKLIGYDVNHKNNGICLPSYTLDIVQHNLQCHRGSHPKALYNDKIDPLLRNLETRSLSYCELDIEGKVTMQKRLMDDLNGMSRRIETKIKEWKWLLRKDALAEREQSFARLSSGEV